MLQFARILWVKSVTLDEDTFAYGGRIPGVRASEPRRAGDVFELHCTPDDADSLADPGSGEMIVLTQHELVTHLVRVIGETVEGRPRRTIRPGTRDVRFTRQRTCELVYLRGFSEAASFEEAFGFRADVAGGEVFSIPELSAFQHSDQPLWAVQRRIAKALEPDRRRSSLVPRDGPLRRLDPGRGRIRRMPG